MEGNKEDFQAITTQEEFDAAITDRLSRERKKYADYDVLKEKAAKYDAGAKDAETRIADLEKAIAGRDAAEQQRALRAKVAKATGVPEDLISGSTEEEMTEYASRINEHFKTVKPPAAHDQTPGKFGEEGSSDDEKRNFVKALMGNTEN